MTIGWMLLGCLLKYLKRKSFSIYFNAKYFGTCLKYLNSGVIMKYDSSALPDANMLAVVSTLGRELHILNSTQYWSAYSELHSILECIF